MFTFGIKDIFDIAIVAMLLYYIYKLMKESGTINLFYGIMAFVIVWLIASEILNMRLLGSILDKFMSIGLIILIIIFQDQIKRFLVEVGSHKRWPLLKKLFGRQDHDSDTDKMSRRVMPIVYACMNMAKSKTGALIVLQQEISLEIYEKTGDMIDADINSRLIENIFFKNSPLHDGALIIANGEIKSAGCILPVSHDSDVPRYMGLRHRSALGIAQATDAVAIVVSEETGRISVAMRGKIYARQSSTDLEKILSEIKI